MTHTMSASWRMLSLCFCAAVAMMACLMRGAAADSSSFSSSSSSEHLASDQSADHSVSGEAASSMHLGPGVGLVALDAFGDHSIRIRIAPTGSSIVEPRYRALLPQPPATSSEPVAPIRAVLSGAVSNSADSASAVPVQAASLTNGNLRVDVDSNGLLIATRLSDGAVLLKQTSISFGTALVSGSGVSPLAMSATVTFAGTVGEKIYGLGEHSNGKVNQQGFTADFRDSHYYPKSYGGDVIIPYYASSLGYGFCWVTAAFGNVSMSEQQISWGMHAAANVDMWITTTAASPSKNSTSSFYVELLSHFVDAVGHATPLPYYSTGFWQSKNRYRNQTQLLSVAYEYVRREIPLSIIVIDYFHWVYLGDWSLNPVCWPDPQSMVDELTKLGIELAVTFWPYITPPSAYFQPFTSAGYVWKDRTTNLSTPVEYWDEVGDMYLVDETNPDAKAAEFQAYWKGYGQYGIKTIWIDATEPERNEYNFGQFTTQNGNSDMESAEAWINLHEQTLHDGMISKGYSVGDFMLLARSSWAGAWSYSSAMWSGDTQSTFTDLSHAVRMAQTTALSGIAVWTTDTGGYSGGDPSDPQFQELIVRWFQFSAFCPIFRVHGSRSGGDPPDECGNTNGPNEVWSLAADEVHYDALVAMVRLREQLRQYVVQLNQDTVRTGMPMVRSLFVQFPNDAVIAADSAEKWSSEYMFGPDWLVSPVTVYGATTQTVYLPVLDSAQQNWTYWFDPKQTFTGGQSITLQTPINEFPLFVRTPTMLWSPTSEPVPAVASV